MKVLFISGTNGDTRRYRCFHQQEQLALNGVESAFREAEDFRILSDVLACDLFILHRVPYSELVAEALELIEGLGKVAIFDTDDLVFDPSLLPHHRIMDTMSPEAQRHYRMQVEGQARTFQRCPYVLTATEFLAQAARQHGKRAFVNRNSLSQEMLAISEEAYRERRRPLEMEGGEDRLVVAYFSGTGSHNHDFLVATGPLTHILEAYPHVELHISGQLDLSEDLGPFAQRIKRTPYLPWRELPFVIAAVDINLAPLEPENPFCRAKSALKYSEAAAVGVPSVASRTEPFERAIVHGSNGLLAGSEEEWIEALTLLIEDGEKRRAMGEAARRDVYLNYLPEQRGRHLVSVLEAIQQDWRSNIRGAGVPSFADPPAEVISALERHLTRQQELIVHREGQLRGQREVIKEREWSLSRLRRSLSEEKERLQTQLEESEQAQAHLEESRQVRAHLTTQLEESKETQVHLQAQLEESGQSQAHLQAQLEESEQAQAHLTTQLEESGQSQAHLTTQLEESKRTQAHLEAQLKHWKSMAVSQQERHREELQHILRSLQPPGSEGTVVTPEMEAPTALLFQQIQEVIGQMQEAERAGWSGFRRKVGRAWLFLRSGQLGALKRGILAQLRRGG